MSDVKVKVGFEGVAEGATELQTATDKLREMGQAAARTGSQVGTLESELASESATLRALKREIAQATAAKTALARSSTATAEATTLTANAATQAGNRFGALAGAAGNVGAVLGQTNPMLGRAGSLIGAMGTASTALTGALGPVGVGFAAVTTAAGILLPLLQDTSDEMGSVADEADRAEQSVRGLAAAMRERDGLASAMAGTGDAATVRRELERNQSELTAALAEQSRIRGEMRSLFANLGGTRDISAVNELSERSREFREQMVPIERQIARLRPIVAEMEQGLRRAERLGGEGTQATDEIAAVNDASSRDDAAREAFNQRRGRGGGRAGGTLDDQIFDARERAAIATQRGIERERQAMAERQIERDRLIHEEAMKHAEEEREAALEAAALREAEYAKELEEAQRAHDLRMELLDKQKAAQRLAQEESQATAVAAIENVGQLGGEVIGVFNEAFQTAIKGQRSFEEAVAEGTIKLLASFGDQLVAMGIGSILEGFTMLVTNPPGAATKIGGGTAMVAFGVGLGAAAAAIPSPGGGGGAPEAPREDAPLADGSGGASQINIIFGAGVQTAQTEQGLARQLRRSLQTPALTLDGR